MWAANSNWSFDECGQGNTIPQNVGDIANLQVNIKAPVNITDPVGQIGQLRFGDPDGNHAFTISGSDLTFASGGGPAVIAKSGGATDIIASSVNLPTGAAINIATGSRLEITGNIKNGGSLSLDGGGTVTGAATFANGSVQAPGNSPGNPSGAAVQTFTKSLTYQIGSVFSWNLDAAENEANGSACPDPANWSGNCFFDIEV